MLSACSSPPAEEANSANAANSVNMVKIDTTTTGTVDAKANLAAQSNQAVVNQLPPELMAAKGNTNVKIGKNDIPGFPGTAGKTITVVKPDMSKMTAQSPTNPGPDNSEISSMMGAGAPVETRVFKSNRYITKIEKTTVTPDKDIRVKVFLKNGETKEFAAGTLDVMKVTGDEIARAVGIEVQPEVPVESDKSTKETTKKP